MHLPLACRNPWLKANGVASQRVSLVVAQAGNATCHHATRDMMSG
jgi:hypothetical protein